MDVTLRGVLRQIDQRTSADHARHRTHTRRHRRTRNPRQDRPTNRQHDQ
jgi:hypothetical protein